MKLIRTNSTQAFALFEGFIVLVVVSALAAFVILPRMARTRCTGCRINCINNLKQVGLSFRTWALDNNDKYPMQVSVTNGGTIELINGSVFSPFQVMSNELCTPKNLKCSQETDSLRGLALTFFSLNIPYSTLT